MTQPPAPATVMEVKDLVAIALGLVAIAISIFQTRKTGHQVSSAIVVKFLDEYSSPEMRLALDELEAFQNRQANLVRQLTMLLASCYDKNLVAVDLEEFKRIALDYCKVHEPAISRSRSKVAWFFHKAWRLHKHGFIDRRTLAAILSLDGAKTFVKTACPLTLAIRFARIHNGNIDTYLTDASVLWYKDAMAYIEKAKRPTPFNRIFNRS